MLIEKIETTRVELKEEIQRVGQRLTRAEANLSRKIEAISADLATPRNDTEIHRTSYGISKKESSRTRFFYSAQPVPCIYP
jgi:hypothetical protein